MDVENFGRIKMEAWSEYKNFVDQLSENWVFRGQVNANWVLKNAIERTDFINQYKGIETVFVKEFQRGARNYLNRDEIPGHIIEWLALMQHHGAPTRLLDFSKSPFIAAYFAFENAHPRIDAVGIWAINIALLRNRSVDILYPEFPAEFDATNRHINESIFEKIFIENKRSLIFPVEPFRMNRRYSLQQSIFVSTGNSFEPFMHQLNFLQEYISKAVIRIELPTAIQKEVIRDLQRMNIHRASLFPDLDGYALSMKMKYESSRSPEEALEKQVEALNDANFKYIP